jgi:hypothetical protein
MSDATATSHVFSGLSAGQYSAQVLATNAIGAGARSVESTSVTITGVTPASTTPASGGGGGGGGTPTPIPTPKASATPTTSPGATPSPTAKPTTNPVATTPSSKIVPGKPTAVAITISKSVNLKQAKSKIISAKGAVISKAIIKISKDNKILVTLPKGTKPGKYNLVIKSKNGKTYKATIVVGKK